MIAGIISEFNPFHLGHKYIINQAKKQCEGVVCIMSGNFVQRGEFAVFDKFTRAKAAIENGADLVIELPCIYSTKSAEGFAKSGVAIAEATEIIDRLYFGAECDDINDLLSVANKIKECDEQIKKELQKGVSYPTARRNAVDSPLLDYPNNILAIEYLRHTALDCISVKRIGKGHDSDDEQYSASAIRKTLDSNTISSMKNCEVAILSKLRTMSAEDFLKIEDVSEGLENRIYSAVRQAGSIDELYDLIKTKRYTFARIRRIILRAYLGITKEYDFDVPYIRILGFNERGKELLGNIKKNASLPIVSRYSDVYLLDDNAKKLFELECRCTDLYNLGYTTPRPCGTEQTSKIIIIDKC